jgi:hypothetical protein
MATRAPQNVRTRLAALREKKPLTKAAQIRALWPEIRASLDNGHSLKAVCECLAADGITLSVQRLGSFVVRNRRASALRNNITEASRVLNSSSQATSIQPTATTKPRENQPVDPLANVRERQVKRPAVDYRPELADAEDLI